MQATLEAQAMEDIDGWLPRVGALGLALASASPLVLAAMLSPSSEGMGTHTQMGLPECGFVIATGYPCATCGCTTAFAHAADGSLLTSFMTQPFGALLALALAMVTLIAGWSAISGMKLAPLGQMMATRHFVLSWVVLLLGAWAYKAALVGIGSSY
jgi:hypothetical protein